LVILLEFLTTASLSSIYTSIEIMETELASRLSVDALLLFHTKDTRFLSASYLPLYSIYSISLEPYH